MEIVNFVNGLVDFKSIGENLNIIVDGLGFHFMPHPAIVHFAIVLPAIALLLQIIGLGNRQNAYSKVANLLFFLGVISVVLATFTGRVVGPEVKSALSSSGANELFNEHMRLGIYLALFYIFLALLKIVSIAVKSRGFRAFMALMMLAGVAGLFVQAQHGGELVYKYGAGISDDIDDEDEDE
jgi:uncharacterized membrane protein